MIGERLNRMSDLESANPVWEPKTIWRRFEGCAHAHPSDDFFVIQGQSACSYAKAREESVKTANGLWAYGVRPGQCVALVMNVCPELVFLILGVARIGARLLVVNPNVGAMELRDMLRESSASYIVAGREGLGGVLEGSNAKAIATCPATADGLGDECVVFADMLQAGDAVESPIWDDPNAVASIMFTSGSSGMPKAVPLSHDQLQRSAYANCLNRGFENGRRVLIPLPLGHCFGYVEGMLAILFCGGAMLLTAARFDAESLLEYAEREKAADMLMTPYQAEKCCEWLEKHPMEFSELHAMYCAGEPYAPQLVSKIRDRFGIDDVVNGFGMTELSGAALQSQPGDDAQHVANRVGRILPAGSAGIPAYGGHLVEYRVVDSETGSVLPPNAIGELECRGATLMKGYLGRAEGTTDDFTQDGWFKTGDIGRFDEEGYLEFCGRRTEAYRINGENVSPRFIERIVSRCPAVVTALAAGVSDSRYGSVGALYVELENDSEQRRLQVERYCEQNLARYQVPKFYRFIGKSQWPLTSSGKIARALVREDAQRRYGK